MHFIFMTLSTYIGIYPFCSQSVVCVSRSSSCGDFCIYIFFPSAEVSLLSMSSSSCKIFVK